MTQKNQRFKLVAVPFLCKRVYLQSERGMGRYIHVTYMLHRRYIYITYLYKYVMSM
jgi:hypothetical protein